MYFALLDVEGREAAGKELEELVTNFATKLREINGKYPIIGFGDTHTDEEICKELYEVIHFGNFRKR